MKTRKVIPAGVIWLVTVTLVACGSPKSQAGREADLAAIETLHEVDMEASKEQDFETLESLLTKDIVMMAPGADFVRGLDAVRDQRRDLATEDPGIEILSYTFDFREVKVLGEYAFEWGTLSGRTKQADGVVRDERYKLLRILRRGPDGWKVHRAIWNTLGT